MDEEQKLKLDKRLKISRIFLLINFVAAIIVLCLDYKVVRYIYYATIVVLIIGLFFLFNVISNHHKKDKTYTLTVLYLANIFIQLMYVVLKLDSCSKGF